MSDPQATAADVIAALIGLLATQAFIMGFVLVRLDALQDQIRERVERARAQLALQRGSVDLPGLVEATVDLADWVPSERRRSFGVLGLLTFPVLGSVLAFGNLRTAFASGNPLVWTTHLTFHHIDVDATSIATLAATFWIMAGYAWLRSRRAAHASKMMVRNSRLKPFGRAYNALNTFRARELELELQIQFEQQDREREARRAKDNKKDKKDKRKEEVHAALLDRRQRADAVMFVDEFLAALADIEADWPVLAWTSLLYAELYTVAESNHSVSRELGLSTARCLELVREHLEVACRLAPDNGWFRLRLATTIRQQAFFEGRLPLVVHSLALCEGHDGRSEVAYEFALLEIVNLVALLLEGADDPDMARRYTARLDQAFGSAIRMPAETDEAILQWCVWNLRHSPRPRPDRVRRHATAALRRLAGEIRAARDDGDVLWRLKKVDDVLDLLCEVADYFPQDSSDDYLRLSRETADLRAPSPVPPFNDRELRSLTGSAEPCVEVLAQALLGRTYVDSGRTLRWSLSLLAHPVRSRPQRGRVLKGMLIVIFQEGLANRLLALPARVGQATSRVAERVRLKCRPVEPPRPLQRHRRLP